jgi:uncharacterized surface protein with fasciclin (FAS1) repeats
VLVIAIVLNALSCRKWDDHIAVKDPNLQINLMQAINNDPALSKFSSLLTKTGYDKIISSSKTYTIWAPGNTAIQNLDPAIVNDTAKLKQFVANHIADNSWLTSAAVTPVRLKMLSGKYVVFSQTSFDIARILKADQYVKNGILHDIDSAIVPQPNIWEYINANTATYQQNAFLVSLNFLGFDSTKATIDSINSQTGQPVYHPGTGITQRNTFTDVYTIGNEDSLYTYFVLQDTNFNSQLNAEMPYFATTSTDTTTRLSGFNLVKDLAVRGQYNLNQLPDTLVSIYNVRIPIDKNNIVKTIKSSNGVIYVMSSINFLLPDKISPIYVQGEFPTAYSRNDKGGNINFRLLMNPVTQKQFRDIYVFNVGGSFTIQYHVNRVYSTKFHVYWVAVNDQQTTTYNQRVAMDSSLTTFPLTTVPLLNYNEVYLGDYTTTRYGSHELYLINTNSTSSGVNTMALDYIKLVPF